MRKIDRQCPGVLTNGYPQSFLQTLSLLLRLKNQTKSMFSFIRLRLTDVCSFKVYPRNVKAIFTSSVTSWNKFLDSFQTAFHAV